MASPPAQFDEPNLEMYHRALSYSPTSMKGGARKTRMGGDNTNTVEKEGYADRPVPLLPDDTQKNLEKLVTAEHGSNHSSAASRRRWMSSADGRLAK